MSKRSGIKKYILLYTIAVLFLCSCLKKDHPITLPPSNGSLVNEVASLGPLGDTTIFYNLKQNKIVKKSYTFDWDIYFESNTNTNAIFMNGGKGNKMYNTHTSDFSALNFSSMQAVAATDWSVDDPNLLSSNSYIGDWEGKDEIYFLANNTTSTYLKIKFLAVTEDSYTIEYAEANASSTTIKTIQKNKKCNYTYFSFATNNTVNNFEPEDYTSWDIMLTQYAYIYKDLNNFSYSVKGVLLNPYNTLGYGDTTKEVNYNTVNLAYANTLPLYKERDIIGFLWKKYENNTYVVYDKFLYMVQTQNNELYKLHFLSYYSNTGESHVPKFEFERLK